MKFYSNIYDSTYSSMMNASNQPHQLKGLIPFLIVDNVQESLDFYQYKLGFKASILIPERNPFFAMVERDSVSIMLKHISDEIHPMPSSSRHEYVGFDLYIDTYDPDSLYEEYKDKEIELYKELEDDHDGLRGFSIKDNNNYVLRFSRRINNPPN